MQGESTGHGDGAHGARGSDIGYKGAIGTAERPLRSLPSASWHFSFELLQAGAIREAGGPPRPLSDSEYPLAPRSPPAAAAVRWTSLQTRLAHAPALATGRHGHARVYAHV